MIKNDRSVFKAFSWYHEKRLADRATLFPAAFSFLPLRLSLTSVTRFRPVKLKADGTSGEPKFIVALSGTKVG